MAENRRGGRRAGRPGADYRNRTDLAMAPRTAPVARIPGQLYGTQGAQVEAQQSAIQAAQVRAESTPQPQMPPTAPLAPVSFAEDTQRPWEPVTAGLRAGPGPGPEYLDDEDDDYLTVLRAAYQKFRNPDLLRIILDEDLRRSA